VTSAPPGSSTSFDASASTVRFGTIAKYVWSFGDGNPGRDDRYADHQPRLRRREHVRGDGDGDRQRGHVYDR
jgi:hypothetical protein